MSGQKNDLDLGVINLDRARRKSNEANNLELGVINLDRARRKSKIRVI